MAWKIPQDATESEMEMFLTRLIIQYYMTDRTSSTPLASHTDSTSSTDSTPYTGNVDSSTNQCDTNYGMHPMIKTGVLISFAVLLTTVTVIMLEDIFEHDKYADECKSLMDVTNAEFSIRECTKYWNAYPEATEQEVFDNMDIRLTNQMLADPVIVPNDDYDT